MKELSSATGVPQKFILVYHEYFKDCTAAENCIHTMLDEKGYRISNNREFFQAPVNEVVKLISQMPKEIFYLDGNDA
jgi:hypothetical protein